MIEIENSNFLNKKTVSIVIPTYQRPQQLTRAIESCLKQTYQAVEILVIDDNEPASSARTKTKQAMARFEQETRVKYICREKNGGGGAARNTGISRASGDYITFLDDDDIYFQHKVEEQVKMMAAGYDMIFSDIEIFYEEIGRRQVQSYKQDFSLDYKGLLTKHLVAVISGTATFMFRREALVRIGGFDSIAANQEYILMLKAITSRLKIGYLPLVLCRSYVSYTRERLSNSEKVITAKIEVLQRIKPHLAEISPPARRKTIFRLYSFIFYQSWKRRKPWTATVYGLRLLPLLDLVLKHERNAVKTKSILYK